MRPILVTGGTGQLAAALARAGGERVHRVGRPEFDFDRPDTLGDVFDGTRPALVVNAAAWTAVDAAEAAPEAAARANRDGPAALAWLCGKAGVPLIHVSTDYVFDGQKGAPYAEDDPTNPTGVYGATKLAGEEAVLELCPRAVVVRTSWVYAAEGRNFLRTMLAASRRADRLRVVADQRGCPTSADDLAAALLGIADRALAGWSEEFRGLFHACGTGETTWHGFAEAIFAAAARHGVASPVVEPIATADWPTHARRPADSRLDCGRLARVFGHGLPPWRESLGRTVDEIFARGALPAS